MVVRYIPLVPDFAAKELSSIRLPDDETGYGFANVGLEISVSKSGTGLTSTVSLTVASNVLVHTIW